MTASVKTIIMELFAFSRHSINLLLDEETLKPRRLLKRQETHKMKQWYQGQDRVNDKSQWQLPSNRVATRSRPLERTELSDMGTN